jgi:hypothetical protein
MDLHDLLYVHAFLPPARTPENAGALLDVRWCAHCGQGVLSDVHLESPIYQDFTPIELRFLELRRNDVPEAEITILKLQARLNLSDALNYEQAKFWREAIPTPWAGAGALGCASALGYRGDK